MNYSQIVTPPSRVTLNLSTCSVTRALPGGSGVWKARKPRGIVGKGPTVLCAVVRTNSNSALRFGELLKAGFHWRRSRSQSRNQKRRAYDLVKIALLFRLRLRRLRSAYDLVKTRLSESEAEAEEPKQSQSVGTCIVIGLSFRFCFRLRQSGFH